MVSQILVNRLPTDAQGPRQLRFLFPTLRPRPQLHDLVWLQGLLTAAKHPALFRPRNAFPLSFTDSGPLNFRKGLHDRQHHLRHRGVLPRKDQVFFHKLDLNAAVRQILHQPPQVIQVASETVHTVHHHGIPLPRKGAQLVPLRPLPIFPGRLVREDTIHPA